MLHSVCRCGSDVYKRQSDAVLLQFERPADQSETAKKRRASFGQKYYDRYAKPKEGQACLLYTSRCV